MLASRPNSSRYGGNPVDLFEFVLSAKRALGRNSCHCSCFPCVRAVIIRPRVLWADSTRLAFGLDAVV